MANLLDSLNMVKKDDNPQTSSPNYQEKKSDLEMGFNHLLGRPISREPLDKKDVTSTEFPVLKNLHTADCIPWKYADRPEDEMGDLEALAQSISDYGQQEPILVRPAKNLPGKYEIIFGHRRWKACRMADKELLAIIKHMTDQEAALFQKEENENREDLSDFSRAQNYRQLLEEQVFASENDLAKYLGIRKQTLNDIFAYIRVPEELRILIPRYKKLSRRLVVKLATHAKTREKLIVLKQLAAKIDSGKVTSSNLENELKKASLDKPLQPVQIKQRDIKHPKTGRVMLKIKHANSGAVNISIAKEFSHLITEDQMIQSLTHLLGIDI